jgi:hypothetical protein
LRALHACEEIFEWDHGPTDELIAVVRAVDESNGGSSPVSSE